MADNNNAVPPEHGDKILFAEDLMAYVMFRVIQLYYTGWRAVQFREFLYNGFDDETELAVDFLGCSMEMEVNQIFHFVRNDNNINILSFMVIADQRRNKYFSHGFEPRKFLKYCVLLASLAAYFFTNGIVEAPDIGVMYITECLENIDMTTGGWEALKRTVQMYASLQDSTGRLSPTSLNSDED